MTNEKQNSEPNVIKEVEVLDETDFNANQVDAKPEMKGRKEEAKQEFEGKIRKLNLHPMSGILILFLDYAFFSTGILSSLVTGGAAYPVILTVLFIVTFLGVFLIQRFISDESAGRSAAKAFFSAVITTTPAPIFGTIFGTLILGASGLTYLSSRNLLSLPKKLLK